MIFVLSSIFDAKLLHFFDFPTSSIHKKTKRPEKGLIFLVALVGDSPPQHPWCEEQDDGIAQLALEVREQTTHLGTDLLENEEE